MTPHKQDNPYDCLKASVAAVADLPYDDVPSFWNQHVGGFGQIEMVKDWAKDAGFKVDVSWSDEQHDGYWIGMFETSPYTSHAVVMLNQAIIHDPCDDPGLKLGRILGSIKIQPVSA